MFVEQTQIFEKGLSKRHACFFKKVLFVCQTNLIILFIILFIEQILIFPETTICYLVLKLKTQTNFPGASIFSSNRYSFSRKPYLVFSQTHSRIVCSLLVWFMWFIAIFYFSHHKGYGIYSIVCLIKGFLHIFPIFF